MSPAGIDLCLDRAGLERWGEALGKEAVEHGVLVALTGPLGAGKTTLVRAASLGAGALEAARSPTYTLHHPHRLAAGDTLHHLDLYRIESPAELDRLGWDEILMSGQATFVEWADRAAGRLPVDRWEIDLAPVEGGRRRRVRARALGCAPEVPAVPQPTESPC